jgi:hypothetical protein
VSPDVPLGRTGSSWMWLDVALVTRRLPCLTFTAIWRGIFGAIWPVYLVRSRS